MIRFDKVTKRLGGRVILDEVDFEIHDRETFFIVGASGAGKSVTLKHMVRLLTPDSGQVWVDDTLVSESTGRQLSELRARFGYLFQGSALLAWLTAAENVALPLREHMDLSEEEIDARVTEMLKLVDLEDVHDQDPAELSGGMRKRVALARAIVRQPKIILYDEPTSGLDPVTSRTIDKLIDSLRRQIGVTSVVVTHDLHSALAIGTRIAMLHDSKIVEISTPADFVRSQNENVRAFLESQYITKRGDWEDPVKS